MKRKLHCYFCALFIGFSVGVYAQTDVTLIPDSNFEQKLIDLGYDDVLDGEVLTNSINTITSLDLQSANISDLTGIEDFTSLNFLYLYYNNLDEIDVSALTQLKQLYLNGNNVSELDLSNNSLLKHLDITGNNLSSLDISNCSQLISLKAYNNNLSYLDISNNTSLTSLFLNNNSFTELTLSNSTLTGLFTEGNSLTSLDLSNLPSLNFLDCSNSGLTSLDVSNNPNLSILKCHNNDLTELDLSNNPDLGELKCMDNALAELDVSLCESIYTVDCSNNNLTAVNVSGASSATTNMLFQFVCDNNQLTSVDFSELGTDSVFKISASNNNFSEVNLSNLDLSGYIQLDFTSNPDLTCILVDEGVSVDPIFLDIDEQTELSPECTALSVSEVDFEAVSIVNPVKDLLVIQLPESVEIHEVSLYNLSGQEILHASNSDIDVSSFSNGLYMAKIITNKGTLVKKILK
ncbi:T9SS type A sorting domain-containing protein [Mangrovimonas sp. TPBH4]|uniref:T9SS type A sorting domain-containing protein n=1 Tax=Mangrovimonas sp. TPBH4 TaxID=1645914 RepID=UPI0018D0C5C2|nr:T9SS type A sorting domain-containing protein [Mangrovimonas sp. TPBH4]